MLCNCKIATTPMFNMRHFSLMKGQEKRIQDICEALIWLTELYGDPMLSSPVILYWCGPAEPGPPPIIGLPTAPPPIIGGEESAWPPPPPVTWKFVRSGSEPGLFMFPSSPSGSLRKLKKAPITKYFRCSWVFFSTHHRLLSTILWDQGQNVY